MNLRRPLTVLLAVALVLPVALCIVLAVGRLLSALGDAAAAAVLDWLALAGGLLWVLDLVGLVVVQALAEVSRQPPPIDELPPEEM